MITMKTVTLDTMERDASDIELFLRIYLAKTGPYPAFPPKAEFLRRLWKTDHVTGKTLPDTPCTFLFIAESKTSPFAFMAGLWYPSFDAAFIECVVRNRSVVYAHQGAALMSYGIGALAVAGVKHVFLPIPDTAFWHHGEKPTALSPEKIEAWALSLGFEKLPFNLLTPPRDAKGRLQEGYTLTYMGPDASPSVAAKVLGEEYRRLGVNPLLASETVYSTVRFDHSPIH